MPKGKRLPRAEIRPPSARGVVVIDSYHGEPRTRAWPRPRGPNRHPTNKFWTDWLVGMTYLYRYLPARMQAQLQAATKGTPWMPRDIMISTGRGRAWAIAATDGRTYFPVAAREAVSQSLDTIAQLAGQMLVRGANAWLPIAPATGPGQVLTVPAIGAAPVWAGGGAGPPSGPETVVWNADAKPTIAGLLDDEFNAGTGGVPAGWTGWDYGGLNNLTQTAAHQRMQLTTSAGRAWAGIYKAIPAGNFDIWTRVSLAHIGNENAAGLALYQTPGLNTGDFIPFTLSRQGTPGFYVQRFAQWDTFTSNLATQAITRTFAYLRVTRNGTSYRFSWSNDGLDWYVLFSTAALGIVPTGFGPVIGHNAGGPTTAAHWGFFRYFAADQGDMPELGGNKVTLYRAA